MKRTNGITLIALVITIILLLILAGIAISQLTENGLFEKSQTAQKAQIESEMTEKLTLAIQELQLEKAGKANLDDVTQQWANSRLQDYENIIVEDVSSSEKGITIEKNGVIINCIINEKLQIAEVETTQNLYYNITKDFENGISIDNETKKIEQNKSYKATVTTQDGYRLKSVKVTMGGQEIELVQEGNVAKIDIQKVAGNIVITAKISEVVYLYNEGKEIPESTWNWVGAKDTNSPGTTIGDNYITVDGTFSYYYCVGASVRTSSKISLNGYEKLGMEWECTEIKAERGSAAVEYGTGMSFGYGTSMVDYGVVNYINSDAVLYRTTGTVTEGVPDLNKRYTTVLSFDNVTDSYYIGMNTGGYKINIYNIWLEK